MKSVLTQRFGASTEPYCHSPGSAARHFLRLDLTRMLCSPWPRLWLSLSPNQTLFPAPIPSTE